ncbi:CBS domain-containing protein [Paraburkholderia dinghuensis]|uniref:CBS domain-containing protein n=1 Tax=Paraburkholderia dinghuensis TaxID=2305225 RepID=A0A3N6MHW6_9BURK|nr:CBS domain-containing protein [Paraburkholderia dinghuensis]RQH02788.1 CBS domain-containing protein [Paraburkholderia dinghuensis]
MRALDVMTTNVVTVKPDMTVRDAAALLVERHISGAPVVDAGGRLVGIISEGDLLRRVELGTDKTRRGRWLDFFAARADADAYVKSHANRVEDVMTHDVICVGEEESLSKIATIMETRGVKRVPILRDGQVVGIVSRSNLLQALASRAPEPETVSATDREIREQLMSELEGRPWSFAGRNLVVEDGVVHLWGIFSSMEAVQAVRVAAERIPGVRSVEDHTEPYPAMPGF